MNASPQSSSDKAVLELVEEMQARNGLTVFTDRDAIFHRWKGAQHHEGGFTVWPAISPDGTALCWGDERAYVRRPPGAAANRPQSLSGGTRPVWLDGQRVQGSLISSQGQVIAAVVQLLGSAARSLLALDLRSGMTVHDLTAFITEFEIPDIRSGSIDNLGTLLASGSDSRVQVIRERWARATTACISRGSRRG